MNIKVALCQLDVEDTREGNLRRAEEMIRRAAGQGADFALLPEMFVCPFANENFPRVAQDLNGDISRRFSALAKELGLYIVAGSIPEREDGKLYNTSYFFDRQGECIGKHRKVHLFDVAMGGPADYRESDVTTPGDSVTVAETEYGPMGLAICYDIRFSDFFRLMSLRGARMIFHPGAFNSVTGPKHWELSIRMRALDQQCFMVSCAPALNPQSVYNSYAHSMIADPYGQTVFQLGEAEELAVVELDLDQVDRVRAALPILKSRRTDLYDTVYKGR